MSVAAILQARTSSSRFPGKVLEEILGEPMLARQIERVRRAREIDRLVVATSTDPSDDPIERICEAIAVACFRGPLDDVLDRFHACAATLPCDQLVRLTGDCPLIDPSIIDATIRFHLDGGYDYSSNALVRTFPDGTDVEVFRRSCLTRIHREATATEEREHVTLGIYRRPGSFSIGSFESSLGRGELRLTVDHPEDLELVRAIYGKLYPANPAFGLEDVLKQLDETPELLRLNARWSAG